MNSLVIVEQGWLRAAQGWLAVEVSGWLCWPPSPTSAYDLPFKVSNPRSKFEAAHDIYVVDQQGFREFLGPVIFLDCVISPGRLDGPHASPAAQPRPQQLH